MAGKLRKGFTTYLLILFIALVAAFLICVTIMLFSPFKSILGMHYFLYDDEVYEYNVTGAEENEIFDFSKIQQVNINCNYANVTVERYVMVDNHAIKITNRSKGFATDAQDSSFSYQLSYKDSQKKVLNIEVNEPEGFLYFSKDITISILVPTKAGYGLENTKIDITNTSGNVYIGNNTKLTTEDNNEINVNSLSVKTNSGRVTMFPLIDNTFNDVFIKTNNGGVEFKKDIVVNKKLEIHTGSGDLSFSGIEASDAIIDVSNGKFSSTNIKANVDLSIKSGYFDVNKIDGNLTSNDINDQMNSATITIKEISGSVSLPFANGSNITIGHMDNTGIFYAHSTSGSITLNKVECTVLAETESGSINIYSCCPESGDEFGRIEATTVSGNINVVYDYPLVKEELIFETDKEGLIFETETGKVNLKVRSALAFLLVVYDSEGDYREDGVYIDWVADKFINPFSVNGGANQNEIKITSNSDIYVSLLDIA